MEKKFSHLSEDQRYVIHNGLARGLTQAMIAELIGKDPSCISREIKRNTGKRGYRPKQAHQKSKERQFKRTSAFTEFARSYILHLLKSDWSPEQIHGRLKALGWQDVPSHEWIYRNICYHPTTREEVKPHLRHPKPYRKHGAAANEKRGRIPNRRSIHEREAQADNCTHIGHHEGDTVIGRNHKGALLTLVERKSLFTHIAAMPNRKSSSTISHCIQQLRSAGARSVTFDNGKEFAEHERLNEFGIDTYFADPYHSWQRGKNENTNGLIRQYLPKWAKLDKVTQAEAEWIARRLNNRPRKSLGWQTPSEVFAGVNNLAFGC